MLLSNHTLCITFYFCLSSQLVYVTVACPLNSLRNNCVKELSTTFSNLLEPQHCRDSKVCRVLSHEFGIVRLYRPSYNRSVERRLHLCGHTIHTTSHCTDCLALPYTVSHYTHCHIVEKVGYSRTTPNSCKRTLHTLLSLQ